MTLLLGERTRVGRGGVGCDLASRPPDILTGVLTVSMSVCCLGTTNKSRGSSCSLAGALDRPTSTLELQNDKRHYWEDLGNSTAIHREVQVPLGSSLAAEPSGGEKDGSPRPTQAPLFSQHPRSHPSSSCLCSLVHTHYTFVCNYKHWCMFTLQPFTECSAIRTPTSSHNYDLW